MSTFTARYGGACASPLCDVRIAPGDAVEYVDDQLVHAGCLPPAEVKPRPVCAECFCEIALNGACSCPT